MRIRTFWLILVLLSGTLSAYEIKPRIGLFFPSDTLFQKIYRTVCPTFELEGTAHFIFPFSAWANLNITSISGYSRGLNDLSGIFIANFSFGAKFSHYFGQFQGYAGLGCVLSGVFIDNENSACCKKSSKLIAGGVLKLGLQRSFARLFFVDYFLDGYYQPVRYHSRRNIGGVRAGVGLGYLF